MEHKKLRLDDELSTNAIEHGIDRYCYHNKLILPPFRDVTISDTEYSVHYGYQCLAFNFDVSQEIRGLQNALQTFTGAVPVQIADMCDIGEEGSGFKGYSINLSPWDESLVENVRSYDRVLLQYNLYIDLLNKLRREYTEFYNSAEDKDDFDLSPYVERYA